MITTFPDFGIKNVRLYYWLGIFLNGWFVLPNWVFYFSQHITWSELGMVEGTAILVGVFMEVPSGVLADLLGKKRILILGSVFQIISCVLLIMASEFVHFLVGNIMMFIGFAFQSGANEAFLYDSLKERSLQKHFGVVTSKYTAIAVVSTVVSTALGGFLFAFQPYYPFVAWIVTLLISVGLLVLTSEPKVDTYTFNFRNYVIHLKEGVVGLFSNRLRDYLIPIVGISILVKLYQGIIRQSMAEYFSFTGETFGYLLAMILIPGAIVSYNFDKIMRVFSERSMVVISSCLYGLAFLVALFTGDMVSGSIVFFIIMVTERIAEPLVSVLINHRIESKHRATILSTKALLAQIPYVILVMGFASITSPEHLPILFSLYVVLMMVVGLYSLVFINKHLSITKEQHYAQRH